MENNTQFLEGDVVELKSGGKDMTVIKVEGEDVSCQWFKKSGDLDGGIFKASSLQKVIKKEKQDEDDN